MQWSPRKLLAARIAGGLLLLGLGWYFLKPFFLPSEPIHEGKYLSEWLADLKGTDPGVRKVAIEALGAIGEPAVPALIPLCEKGPSEVREAAILALAQIGPAAKAAVPTLIHIALRDLTTNLCPVAIKALGEMGEPAVGALITALKTYRPILQRAAAQALGHMGSEAKEAIPALLDAMYSSDEEVQRQVVEALGQIDPPAKQVYSFLPKLKGRDVHDRRAAAEALREKGPGAKPAVRALAVALRDPDEEVRKLAAEALGRIGPAAKEAVPFLIPAMKERNPAVQRAAAAALKQIDPEAARRGGIR
jgi:HEAT repeat protein